MQEGRPAATAGDLLDHDAMTRAQTILTMCLCLLAGGCGDDLHDDGFTGEIIGTPLRSAPRVEASAGDEPAEDVAGDARVSEPGESAPEEIESAEIENAKIENAGTEIAGDGADEEDEPVATVESGPPPDDGIPLEVTLAQLGSWPFAPPEGQDPDPDDWEAQIPDSMRALDGRRITIEGYITPIKVANRKVVRVLFTIGHFGCCFGAMPKMNEWIIIDMDEDVAMSHAPLDPVRFTGRLEVGGLIDEQRYLYAIYRMQAESHEVVGQH